MLTKYKLTVKRQWVGEKSDLSTLLGNIQTKMSTYRMSAYEPPKELSLENVDKLWGELLKAERDGSTRINQKLRE